MSILIEDMNLPKKDYIDIRINKDGNINILRCDEGIDSSLDYNAEEISSDHDDLVERWLIDHKLCPFIRAYVGGDAEYEMYDIITNTPALIKATKNFSKPKIKEPSRLITCKECMYSHMTYSGFCKYCDLNTDDDGNLIELYRSGDYYCADARYRI